MAVEAQRVIAKMKEQGGELLLQTAILQVQLEEMTRERDEALMTLSEMRGEAHVEERRDDVDV